MMTVVSVISRMKTLLSETLIESVAAGLDQMPSSAGLDSLKISALACGFLMELILAVAPYLRGCLAAWCRMVTVGLSSETA